MTKKDIIILGIESSCDDTSAAVLCNDRLLSNEIANQDIHKAYGGVVPELASRAHQQNIIPVVDRAIHQSGIKANDIDAVAFTQGPGLLGSLLVGTSFAKGFSLAKSIPLISVNHLQAHVLALFIQDNQQKHDTPQYKHNTSVPNFPFLCLLVSGGHSQILIVNDYLDMQVIGQTIDDAAGEAFDKCGKLMGLQYPAGPDIDRYAKMGNPAAFSFSKPKVKALDYSFSGLKTSFLYFLRDQLKQDSKFIDNNLYDLCSSLQRTIVEILMHKLRQASLETDIREIGIAGGVSANSGLKDALIHEAATSGWKVHIPKLAYTMDNAAMIGLTGYYKYTKGLFANQDIAPSARI
ncbi:MAG: tRNA (adenosine(37)-N6)-threonylcarbamoyltransferase complex transferase subunit TsaD [Bacteroidales bacterium]|nr:tRNA (adenosine(37)-N6)-threonylcarbamoyltransferase complex transferase subunit TsaD [Bacteroidales bacterium]